MNQGTSDITETLFLLPMDAKLLRVSELSNRLRSKIGSVDNSQSVITRPGFRMTTRLIPEPLTALISEFRKPSLLTDAVLRFSRACDQDPLAMLDLSFDALATLVEARILVPENTPDAQVLEPSLGAGQIFASLEVESLVRSLEDTEVYRAYEPNGEVVALKIAREGRQDIDSVLGREASMLDRLGGEDSPKLLDHGVHRGRAYVVMEWCDGVPIAVAAQQARASHDQRRLYRIIKNMLEAYGRLHRKGVLHGDIHPGNCLVCDDDRVVILDFGSARLDVGYNLADPARVGIPHFYDPVMAKALLKKKIPPAATPASEQFSISVLAYMLVTGLYPVDTPAVQDELLRNIVDRPTLPFAAQGIRAWPSVEAVIRRGLAKHPSERFPCVADMARAFAFAREAPDESRFRSKQDDYELATLIEEARNIQPSDEQQLLRSWLALRASLATEDGELLAAADVLVSRASSGWAKHVVTAKIAQTRSDNWTEHQAIEQFMMTAETLTDNCEALTTILAAAEILNGPTSRNADIAVLASWASQRLERFMVPTCVNATTPSVVESLTSLAALSLAKTKTVAIPSWLGSTLDLLDQTQEGNVWLWSLAYDVFAEQRFKTRALKVKLPNDPIVRGFAFLRLHQLTGSMHWVANARRLVMACSKAGLSDRRTALLTVELNAPERAIFPFFIFNFPDLVLN